MRILYALSMLSDSHTPNIVDQLEMMAGSLTRGDAKLNSEIFAQGIASGDPGSHDVVLWTRINAFAHQVPVMWMIADSESFDNVVDIGLCHTGPKYDHCVKVIAKNLQPNTGYYFKFICGQFCSPIGRTFTKSVPSNFPQMDWPEKGFEFDRLDEYRSYFEDFKSDPDVQDLHAKFPWTNEAEFPSSDKNSKKDWFERNTTKLRARAITEWFPIRDERLGCTSIGAPDFIIEGHLV